MLLTAVISQRLGAHLKRRVGLGIGLGVRPLLLTRICSEGEKHCCLQKRQKTDKMGMILNINHQHQGIKTSQVD